MFAKHVRTISMQFFRGALTISQELSQPMMVYTASPMVGPEVSAHDSSPVDRIDEVDRASHWRVYRTKHYMAMVSAS